MLKPADAALAAVFSAGICGILEFVWPAQISSMFAILHNRGKEKVARARGRSDSLTLKVRRFLIFTVMLSPLLYESFQQVLVGAYAAMVLVLFYGALICYREIAPIYRGLARAADRKE
jgi:hypothetical protein